MDNVSLIKPKQLKKGDTIGLVSPSSGLWERSVLWSAIENLEKAGMKVKLAKNVYENTFYFAGNDEFRAEELMKMFQDDEVDAVFCTQGGYGGARLWKYLNFDIIKQNPKIFLGYSDITALHMAIHKKTGLVTFHGPNVFKLSNRNITEYNSEHLKRALTAHSPVGEINVTSEKDYFVKVVPGKVEAPIIGGNLSLICGTLGTPYEIDTKGKILFLEDIGVSPWVLDHLLSHLYNAGKLHDALGFVVGECTECEPKPDNDYFPERSFEDIVFDVLGSLGKPTLMNLPLGHTKNLATIPEGVMAKLDATSGKLEIVEKGVTL